MKHFVLAAFLLMGMGAFGAGSETQRLLPAYLKLHSALIADSLTQATQAAAELNSSTEKNIQTAASQIKAAQNLDQARKLFKPLAKIFVEWARQTKPPGLTIMYCPMAKARWLQEGQTVQNPFYGPDMRTCGVKQN